MSKPIVEVKDRLQEALDLRQISQQELSEKTKIPKASISQYLSGYAKPKDDRIHLMSRALDVQEPWLLGYDVPIKYIAPSLEGVTNLIRPSVKPVPILGNVCAGNGVWCEDNFDGYFFIDNSVKADMCLRVKGDSMTEAGIDDGDYAFIRETYDYFNGRIYAVRINDDCDAVLKKITIQEETIILSPCNDEYEPIVKRLDEVSIIGECIGTYHTI